jgi:hypothetical protein
MSPATKPRPAGHGPNIGHGYVKYVIIDSTGVELPPVVFPAQIAQAAQRVSGALKAAATVKAGNARWWVGEDAQLATPLTMLAQDRLQHAAFIPALLGSALERFGSLNGTASGYCVSGLPATWAEDAEKAKALGARLREAHPYGHLRVIAEPLGLAYAAILDNFGRIVGDPTLTTGRIGVVDLGHHTVDLAELLRLAVVKDSYDTWQLGTAAALRTIRAQLAAATERELSLAETDQAVRAGAIRVAGKARALPAGWDRPLVEQGQQLVSRLRERWGKGGQFDAILLGGGGAAERRLVEPILASYPHAQVVAEPQTAIARGYARLARRLGGAA